MILDRLERMREKMFPLPENFDKTVVDSYLWANQRFPQAPQAIAIIFADAALSEPGFDPVRLSERRLSSEELTKLGDAMDIIHAAYGIPVATERGRDIVLEGIRKKRKLETTDGITVATIDHALLESLWVSFKDRTLAVLAAAAGITDESEAWPHGRDTDGKDLGRRSYQSGRLRALSTLLKNPTVDARVRATIHSFASTLRSEEGQEMGRKIRESVSLPAENDDDKWARSMDMRDLYSQLMALCAKKYAAGRQLSELDEDMLERMVETINDLQ